MKRLLSLLLFFSLVIIKSATANTSVWSDVATPENRLAKGSFSEIRWLKLTESDLLKQLNIAPDESTQNRLRKNTVQQIELPLPNGRSVLVRAEKSSIMEAGLAEKYPEIQTWKIHGINGEVLSGRVDFTPAGFHAILSLSNGKTVLIDPKNVSGINYYQSHQYNSHNSASHKCSFNNASSALKIPNRLNRKLTKAGSTLHTYRLALATTGQYTQFFGGSVSQGLAAVVTTINRVNEIYERDLSIRLILVAENDQIIYTSPFSDPYSNGFDNLMADQNQFNTDDVIGANNYDIGHVFGTGNGGIAEHASVCQDDIKAGAATNIQSPTGDEFYIDFVAHEIGHQFGAEHSFNSTQLSCTQRQSNVAVEPGSGSTIMAYAGICGSDDLQENSDAFFHAVSIGQIIDYSHEGQGASCAGTILLNNSNPVAKAGTNRTIPARTPFFLTGSASDANGDTLSYTWDQMDAGTASEVDIDKGDNAIIRSYPPSAFAERTIPKLSDLLAGTHTKGEILPTTSRTLKFKFGVRDGKGGVSFDDLRLTVHDTGTAFSITSQTSSAVTLKKGDSAQITWNVANTDASPINCDKVDIGLSTNGGTSFTNIVSDVQNDGSESITIPANTTTSSKARVKVSCSNNIFFAISPSNFSVSNTTSGGNSGGGSSSSGGGSILPQTLFLLTMFAGFISYRRRLIKGA
ncbi:MAG TPA: hypothetical protein EYG68_04840 [Leucothrix mucor]|nr:hypothetical protein [Leucothrix mucor]